MPALLVIITTVISLSQTSPWNQSHMESHFAIRVLVAESHRWLSVWPVCPCFPFPHIPLLPALTGLLLYLHLLALAKVCSPLVKSSGPCFLILLPLSKIAVIDYSFLKNTCVLASRMFLFSSDLTSHSWSHCCLFVFYTFELWCFRV